MKKIFSILLCAVLLALATPVSASAEGDLLYACYGMDDRYLYCIGAPVEGGEVTVTCGGSVLTDCRLTTVRDAGVPITCLIVMDQSSAFSNIQRNQQKDALLLFSEKLRPMDRMILGRMHLELTIEDAPADREGRAQQIEEACVYTAIGSDPYQTIVTCLDYLKETEMTKGLCCLVMLSDGIDDWGMEVNEQMARKALRESGISYHTWSLVDPYPQAYARRNAELMASLSAETPGGINVTPNRDGMETGDGVAQIMAAALDSAVIQVDTAQLDRSGSTADIQITWQSGGRTRSGSLSIPTDALPPIVQPPAETEPQIPETEAPAETEAPEITQPETAPTQASMIPEAYATPKDSRPFYIMIAGGILLVVLMAILLIVRSRAQEKKPEEAPEEAPEKPRSRFAQEEVPQPDEPEEAAGSAPEAAEEAAESADEPVPAEELPPEPVADADPEPDFDAREIEFADGELEAISFLARAETFESQPGSEELLAGSTVRMMPLGYPERIVEFDLPVNTPKTVGRSPRADVVLDESDLALSRFHFLLQWNGRALFLQDLHSANGTSVNSIPLKSGTWVRVRNGSLIRAGGYKYNIYSEKME